MFILAAIPVMLGTGIIMRCFEPFPLDCRTGATFVHDWFAIGLFFAVLGHIVLAGSDETTALFCRVRGVRRGPRPRGTRGLRAPRTRDART